MINLNSPALLALNESCQVKTDLRLINSHIYFSSHQQWNHECGWKNVLKNLRLIVQPLLLFCLIYPWIDIFINSQLLLVFNHLIGAINQFKPSYVSG